jgi:hypothetical protein
MAQYNYRKVGAHTHYYDVNYYPASKVIDRMAAAKEAAEQSAMEHGYPTLIWSNEDTPIDDMLRLNQQAQVRDHNGDHVCFYVVYAWLRYDAKVHAEFKAGA